MNKISDFVLCIFNQKRPDKCNVCEKNKNKKEGRLNLLFKTAYYQNEKFIR